jgi:hypothetical protein
MLDIMLVLSPATRNRNRCQELPPFWALPRH